MLEPKPAVRDVVLSDADMINDMQLKINNKDICLHCPWNNEQWRGGREPGAGEAPSLT